MTLNYPDGRSFSSNGNTSNTQKRTKKEVRFGDRGMHLEEEINETNIFYREHDQAVIYKKPIPVQIVKVDYPKRSKAVIKEAYFKQASTTDYNGIYRGYYVDFEAKETTLKQSFPLKNFHQHQIDHLKACKKQGGICFVIMKYVTLNRYFLVDADIIFDYWDKKNIDGSKSIKVDQIEKIGIELKSGYRPTLDYLPAVDKLIAAKQGELNEDY
ncbi:Holliday junction resolvase RecU [Companilactobacillus metriopterae]|uniref:Holliday junction resolvase RecU n=1 Tax=Companilactobacillus metriopterae TaxID=1909267 RepID=UPI00100C0D9D|nr:Holliday junction resolvase RecU [Companilactobacillus metriopterae]